MRIRKTATLLKRPADSVVVRLGGIHGGLEPPPIVVLDGVVAVGDGEALKAVAAGTDHEDGVEVEFVHAGQLKARQGAAWTFKIFLNFTTVQNFIFVATFTNTSIERLTYFLKSRFFKE
jgi:hypothetical protein